MVKYFNQNYFRCLLVARFLFLADGATPSLLEKLQEMPSKPLSSLNKENFISGINDNLYYTLQANYNRMMDLLRVNP